MEQVTPHDAPYDVMLEAKHKELAVLDVRHYLDTGEMPDRSVELEAVAEADG